MRVLITRPREDADPLADLLRRLGVDAQIEPLLRIRYRDGPPIDLGGVQALLATSANGVRAFARRNAERDLPIFAVGDASARSARRLGFRTVESADGDVSALAGLVSARLRGDGGTLVHVAGSAVAGDLAGLLERDGFVCRRHVLYEADTVERLSEQARTALARGRLDGVLVFSPRTADSLAAVLERERLVSACRSVVAFSLNAAVAGRLRRIPWLAMRVAARPEQAALIEEIRAWIGADAGGTSPARAEFASPRRRQPC